MGFCSRVLSRHNQNSPREAHERHFSTFTTDPSERFENGNTAIEPDYPRHAVDDRADHYAGIVALERKRRQLSHHPTAFQHDDSLVGYLLVIFQRTTF